LEVTKEMAGSKKHRRGKSRRENARTDLIISVAVRIVMMIWEVVWTLVREHLLRGTGPGRLL